MENLNTVYNLMRNPQSITPDGMPFSLLTVFAHVRT